MHPKLEHSSELSHDGNTVSAKKLPKNAASSMRTSGFSRRNCFSFLTFIKRLPALRCLIRRNCLSRFICDLTDLNFNCVIRISFNWYDSLECWRSVSAISSCKISPCSHPTRTVANYNDGNEKWEVSSHQTIYRLLLPTECSYTWWCRYETDWFQYNIRKLFSNSE